MKNMYALLLLLLTVAPVLLRAQGDNLQVRVYNFEDGLSHREVSRIVQDSTGFLWIATINGINRFDGYQFLRYQSQDPVYRIPFDVVADMTVGRDNRLILAGQDQLAFGWPHENRFRSVYIQQNPGIARQAMIPYNLQEDTAGNLWMAAFDEKTGRTRIVIRRPNARIDTLALLEGQYPRRPIVRWGNNMVVAAREDELWEMTPSGKIANKIQLPETGRIVHLQSTEGRLWMLSLTGRIFYLSKGGKKVRPHPLNRLMPEEGIFQTLLVEPDGSLWLGGQGQLWRYDAQTWELSDYDVRVRQIVKSIPTYRQIFLDRSGVIWVASNYGLIKVVESEKLFTHYLNGGSEYCSNLLCSVRGMAEDESGKIYISYYNSIHVLDPASNSLNPLFPANDYFNYPFGLLYHDNALWTGNGRRVDLKTLKVDTIFNITPEDVGAVALGKDNAIWYGYKQHLFRYDPKTKQLSEYRDKQGKWDARRGEISYLLFSQDGQSLWVGTTDKGLYQLRISKKTFQRFHEGKNSPIRLSHPRVNTLHEDARGRLWVGTAKGLEMIDPATGRSHIYTTTDGLSNDFINGILPEGDSCLWISTDLGLNRLSVATGRFLNFTVQDGLTHNEFNRMAFLRTRNGRLYFGGLDGVNAFYPGSQFFQRRHKPMEVPMLLTSVTRFDGRSDSVVSLGFLGNLNQLELSHRDKFFGFSFALANFRQPMENKFSYILENYDKKWTTPNNTHVVRYNNIPAGRYTFRVRALVDGNVWNSKELAIKVNIQEAFYRTPAFFLLCALLLIGGSYGFFRYRIYTLRKRQEALEHLVRIRTMELENEKHKSEQLLLNILPAETAEELKTTGRATARHYEHVTVMFTDFQGFSRIAEQLDPGELVQVVDYCFSAFDEIIDRHGLEKIKTIGDAYMCMHPGAPEDGGKQGAIQVVEAAREIQAFLKQSGEDPSRRHFPALAARIGIHTGPVVAGVVGLKKFAYDIWGDTVNIASRMESECAPQAINISDTTYQLVRDRFSCRFHGQFTARNAHDIDMYLVE